MVASFPGSTPQIFSSCFSYTPSDKKLGWRPGNEAIALWRWSDIYIHLYYRSDSQIKLSDFGMARILDEYSEVYNLSNLQDRIPIAWYVHVHSALRLFVVIRTLRNKDAWLICYLLLIASYPGLPSQLFSQPWKKKRGREKSCEGRSGYEAMLLIPTVLQWNPS